MKINKISMDKYKELMLTDLNSKKSLHISEVGASGVYVGNVEQVIVQFFLKYDKILSNRWFFTKNKLVMPSSL